MPVERMNNPYEDKYAKLTGRESIRDVGLSYADIFKAGYAQNKAIEIMLLEVQKSVGPLSPTTKEKITRSFLTRVEKEKLFNFENTQSADEKGAILGKLIGECVPLIREWQDQMAAEGLQKQESEFGKLDARSFIEVVSTGLGTEAAVERALKDLEQLEYIVLDETERDEVAIELTNRMSHLFADPKANSELSRSEKEKVAAELASITHAVAELYQHKVKPLEATETNANEESDDDFDFGLDDAFEAFEAPVQNKPSSVTTLQPRVRQVPPESQERPADSEQAA